MPDLSTVGTVARAADAGSCHERLVSLLASSLGICITDWPRIDDEAGVISEHACRCGSCPRCCAGGVLFCWFRLLRSADVNATDYGQEQTVIFVAGKQDSIDG